MPDLRALMNFLRFRLAGSESFENHGNNIYRPKDSSHDNVCVHHSALGVGKLKTEATIDDTKNHNSTPVPDVRMAYPSAFLMLAIHLMMLPSQQRLDT